MNYLKLEEGDAIYVPADAPQAYLSGNLVECMARYNNVLNAGFCPPADRDKIDLFSDSLTFSSHSDKDVILPAKPSDKGKKGRTEIYAPPMSEFDMLRTRLNKGESELVAAVNGPGILFVTSGEGTMSAGGDKFELKKGYVFFIGAGVEIHMEGMSADKLDVWRATVEWNWLVRASLEITESIEHH